METHTRLLACWDRCSRASVGSSRVAMIRVFSMVMQLGRPSGAALEPGVSQQAFDNAAGIQVARLISARVTPARKIPIGGAGLGDSGRKSHRLAGPPNRLKRAAKGPPRFRLPASHY